MQKQKYNIHIKGSYQKTAPVHKAPIRKELTNNNHYNKRSLAHDQPYTQSRALRI